MLKERARLLAGLIFSADILLTAVAFFLAYWGRAELLPAIAPKTFSAPFYPVARYLPLLPLLLLIWGSLFLISGRYRSQRIVPLVEEAWEIIKVCVAGLAILALVGFASRLDVLLLGDDQISRIWILLFGLCTCLLLLTEKLTIRTVSRYVRSKGYNYRTVLIAGTHAGAIDLADSIRDHRYWGYKILGFVAHPESDTDNFPLRYPLLGTIDDIPRLVEEMPVDDVLFCVSRRALDRMENLFLLLHEQGIITRFALNLFPNTKAQVRLEELAGVPLLTFSTAPQKPIPLFAKRALDVALSMLLLFLAGPVVLGVGLLVKLTSGGEIFYRQTRCGLNGRLFTLYKFRTMVEGAEEKLGELLHLNEMNGPVFKLSHDPRVTSFGRFLRKFSLDELPQLWNVLRGDMSLVGPRPPIPSEVKKYQRWQRRRLSMKPGLTCLWQISGRNQLDFNRWIELDLEYIDTWSPWLDLKILCKTVPAVLSGRGAS